MAYVTGAIAGLLFGGIIGYLKALFIWKKYLKNAAKDRAGEYEAGNVYGRAMISYFVNILTLVAAFLLRNIVPFNGIAFIIGTAVSLAAMNQIMALWQKKTERKM